MKIGLSSHMSFDLSPLNFVRLVGKLKVDFLEIKLDDMRIQRLLQGGGTQRLQELTDAFDLQVIAHLPYIDMNLASLNTEIASASTNSLQKWISTASQMNVDILVSHVGRISSNYPATYLKSARQNAIRSLHHLAETAKRYGLKFTVENDHNSPNHVIAGYASDVKKIAEEVGCEVTFDVGHANTIDKPSSFISALSGLIANVHLHDNDGKSDQHLPIGRGNIDFPETLRKLKENNYDGPLIIESHSLNDLSTDLSRLRNMLSTI